MSRVVPEWIADHDDQAIPTRVKARIFERCGGRCALSGIKLGPGSPFDFDHIISLAAGGSHRETNIQVLARAKHREKTADDVAIKSKIARIQAKNLGLKPKGRGFSPHLTKGMDGKVRPRAQFRKEATDV
jgi:hypothetical protein